jgi:O-antigen/teichoic acid export membrane protein
LNKFRSKILDISSIGVADIISSAIAAIFWFYFATVLGPHSYVQITYLLSIAGIVGGIAAFGSNQTLMVLSAKKIEVENSIYVIALGVGSISSAISFLFVQELGPSLVIIGQIMLTVVTGSLLGKKLFFRYSKFVIIQKVLMVIFGLLFYHLFQDQGILIGMGISYLPFMIEIMHSFKNSKIDFTLLKQKQSFVINNFMLSLAATMYSSLDKLIIVPFFGYAILGNYSLGYQFFFMLSIIPLVIQKYVIPHQVTGNQNIKLKKMMIILSVIMAVLSSLIGPEIISHIFPKFIEATNIIRIMSWAIIPVTINTVIYYPKFWANERNHNVTITTVVIVIIQIISILTLGSRYGTNGIAYAFLIAHVVGLFTAVILDRLKLRINNVDNS